MFIHIILSYLYYLHVYAQAHFIEQNKQKIIMHVFIGIL